MKFKSTRTLCSSTALAGCLLGGIVTAPAAAQDADSDQVATLETVIVTAQKRAESLETVPVAVSAIDASKLAETGVQTVKDIVRLAPSLDVQSNTSPLEGNFRIRRIGNLGNIPTFEPAVGLFVDGAYRPRSVFGVGDLFNLERVEVLRGPQSSLHGKNTTAGVVGIYTAAPSDKFMGAGEITLGQAEGGRDGVLTRLRGSVSGPLSDSVRGSLTGTYSYQDEILTQALTNGGEDGNGVDRATLRGQLAWDINERASARLIAGIVRDDARSQSEDIFFDPDGFIAGIILPTLQSVGVSDTCTDNHPHNRVSCVRIATTSEVDAAEITGLFDYEFSNGVTFKSISSYDRYYFEGSKDDVAQIIAPVLLYRDTQEGESLQQEFRLSSPGGERFDWLLGTFIYHNEFRRGDGSNRPMFVFDTASDNAVISALNQAVLGAPIPVPFATQGQLGLQDSGQDTDYFAVFAQASYDLTDSLTINGGLRWQREEKDAFVRQSVNDPSPSVISLLLSPSAVSVEGLNRSTEDVSWLITPQWTFGENQSVYFTASKGFKSGGFNVGFGTLPIDQREFQDEDIEHFEAGLKTRFLNNRGRIAASVFQTTIENYQDAAFIGAQFTVGNAEEAELKGFEVEGSVLLSDTVTADFAVSNADFSYVTNTSGQCSPGRASDSPTIPGACDLSGENPVNAPEWKASLGLGYQNDFNWGEGFAHLNLAYVDEYNTSFSADPLLTQGAYTWVDLRAGARWDNLELTAWVSNLTDETVVDFDAVVNIYAGDGSFQSYIQPPRTYGLTLRTDF